MVTKIYTLVDNGRDEYPGDGLRLKGTEGRHLDKHFLQDMGLEVQLGDEIEITARVVSRVETRRVPVES